jgi:hypothetical protein
MVLRQQVKAYARLHHIQDDRSKRHTHD